MKRKRKRNRYCRYSKISGRLFLRILHEFTSGRSASFAAQKLPVSLRSINSLYVRLRKRIASELHSSPDAFCCAGFFLELASTYRVERGAKWRGLGFPSVGCWWACDRELLDSTSRRASERHVPKMYRETHFIEILVREHLRKGFSETAILARAQITTYLNDLRAIADAVVTAGRPGNMAEYGRLYTLLDQKRKKTTSRRGEIFYEKLRKDLLIRPL